MNWPRAASSQDLGQRFGALLGGLLGDRVGIVTMLNIQVLGYGTAGMIVLFALRARATQ